MCCRSWSDTGAQNQSVNSSRDAPCRDCFDPTNATISFLWCAGEYRLKCLPISELNPADGITQEQEGVFRKLLEEVAFTWFHNMGYMGMMGIQDYIYGRPPDTYALLEWNTSSSLKLLQKHMKRGEPGSWHVLYMPYSCATPSYKLENAPPQCDPFWHMDLPQNTDSSFFAVFRCLPIFLSLFFN